MAASTVCVSCQQCPSTLCPQTQLSTKENWLKGRARAERDRKRLLCPSRHHHTPMSHALSRHSKSGEKRPGSAEPLQRGNGTSSSRHTAALGDNSAGSHSATNLHTYFTKELSSSPSTDCLQASDTRGKKRRPSDSTHPNHSSKESSSHCAKRKKRTSSSAESPLAERTMSSLPSQSTSAFKNGVHPVMRSNSTESGPAAVTKPRQAKKLVIKNLKGTYALCNVVEAHCYALQCRRIDCEQLCSSINQQLIAGRFVSS